MIPDPLRLHFTLKSDAAFGRGDGVAGEIDAEVQHDDLGLPFFGGRALKGVLVIECADLLFALEQQTGDRWWNAARNLFGIPGSTASEGGALVVGDAHVPSELREAVRYALTQGLSTHHVLRSLTTLRKQTAIGIETGAPQDETLRTMRVVLRKTTFSALLRFRTDVGDDELDLLSVCVASLRRLGTARNRGCGEIEAWLTDEYGQRTDLNRDIERFIAKVTPS